MATEQDDDAHAATLAPSPVAPREDRSFRSVSRADYERGAELARGGMGRIIAGRDLRHDRPVAIKELLIQDPGLEARFRREALVTARLQHPAIVPIYEAGTWDDGEPFYAMKRVEGNALDSAIAARSTLAERLVLLTNVIAVTEAIAYAHARGVIHRDLKPHNVLVGAFGETVVIDWGLAKDLRAGSVDRAPTAAVAIAEPGLTLAGQTLGTPAYMPPEQALGEDVDERADVYALGAMLYHLLSGAPPYPSSKTPDEALARVIAGPPAPLVDVPPELRAIVERAMASAPAARYPTAHGLADELKRYVAGQRVHAHAYSLTSLFARWARRHKGVLAVASIAIVAAVVGLALYVRDLGAERARTEEQRRAVALELDRQRTLNAELLQQTGMSLLTSGQPLQAAPYLSRSYSMGNEGVGIRVLLGVAMPSVSATTLIDGDGGWLVAFAADDRIAVARSDGTVQVWDMGTGRAIATLPGADVDVLEIGWIANDQLAIAYEDGSGRIWRPGAGAQLAAIRAAPGPRPVARFAPGSTHLLTSGEAGARIIDAVDGRVISEMPASPATFSGTAFSPRGDRIAIATGAVVRIADSATGRLLRVLEGATEEIVGIQFDPGGSRLLTRNKHQIQVWDAETGALLSTKVSSGAGRVSFDPRGTNIVDTSDPAVVREVGSERELALPRSVNGTPGITVDASFSPDGSLLATASSDGGVRIWDAVHLELLATLRTEAHQASLARFSPDGARLVTVHLDGAIRIWDASSLALPRSFRQGSRVFQASLDATGERIVTAGEDHTAVVWDIRSGERLVTLDQHGSRVARASFSPDGTAVVTTGDDGTARIWNVARGEAVTVIVVPGGLGASAFIGDGASIVTAGSDGAARFWDASNGDSLRAIQAGTEALNAAVVSPDGGHLVTVSESGQIRSWNLATDAAEWTIDLDAVTVMAFSRDGSRIVTGGADNSVRIWNAMTGVPVSELRGTPVQVFAVAFSADGALLATAGVDGWIRLWDVEGERVLHQWQASNSPLPSLQFTGDGRFILAGSWDGTARLWSVPFETRSAEAVAAAVAVGSPYRLDEDGTLSAQ